jgi:hypothetical protein
MGTSTDISTRRFSARFSGDSLDARGRCLVKPWEVVRLGSILLLAISRWTTETARAEDSSQLERNLAVEMGVSVVQILGAHLGHPREHFPVGDEGIDTYPEEATVKVKSCTETPRVRQ